MIASSFSILKPTLIISNLLNLASLIQLIEFVTGSVAGEISDRMGVFNKYIISGFSGGIIQQARCLFVIELCLFKYTTFRSYKKSQVHNYKYSDAQLRVSTGNELNIGFSQFKSSTPAIVIGYGIQQLKLAAAKAETGISKKIPQCLLPLTIDSNDD
ncbi:MAG: hypothetical protein EZS28_055697, partial [Streblomastix strix]